MHLTVLHSIVLPFLEDKIYRVQNGVKKQKLIAYKWSKHQRAQTSTSTLFPSLMFLSHYHNHYLEFLFQHMMMMAFIDFEMYVDIGMSLLPLGHA